MADVRPFHAVTYALAGVGTDLTTKAAPPYDVVDDAMRRRLLAADPTNIVALELAEGPLDPAAPDGRYATAHRRLAQWLADGTLVTDDEPAIWILEQRFTHHGGPAKRRAVFATVKLEPFSAGIVLPHERTLPKARADRMEMIRATAANLSPVVGLYPDAQGVAAAALETTTAAEPTAAADVEGVHALLWRITDPATVAAFTGALAAGPSTSPTATTATRPRWPIGTSAAPRQVRARRATRPTTTS